MLKLLESLLASKKQVIEVIPRDPTRLRLSEWRASPEMVKLANGLMAQGLRQMIDVLQTEHPGNSCLADAVPSDIRLIWQARGEGYTMALANLEKMAQYERQVEPLVATFEPPEIEK